MPKLLHQLRFLAWLVVIPALAGEPEARSNMEAYWPQWRGPLATGVAPHGDPPVSWSETNNIQWKLPLQGEGDSTPIVWADRVFLLAAIPSGPDTRSTSTDKKSNAPYRFAVL